MTELVRVNVRFVHALIRQQDCQPDEVAVLLANKSKLDKATKALSDEGKTTTTAAAAATTTTTTTTNTTTATTRVSSHQDTQ